MLPWLHSVGWSRAAAWQKGRVSADGTRRAIGEAPFAGGRARAARRRGARGAGRTVARALRPRRGRLGVRALRCAGAEPGPPGEGGLAELADRCPAFSVRGGEDFYSPERHDSGLFLI